MANDNRKYVGLQVKLEGKDTVKKELQDIFRYVNENKNIKLNIDTSSLNGFKESLTKIESEIGKLASSKIINTDSLKNDVNNIDNVTNKINNLQNTSGKITSTSIKFVDNKAVQDITNLNQGLGKTEKIITDLNTKSQTIIKTDNLQKAEKETQKVADSYDKLLAKINQFKDKGIFNNSIYNNKTNGLDSMMKNVDFTNLEKASTQIKTISSRLDDLSSKSNKINDIQKALDSFKNSYDNLRKGENKEIFATLNVSDINSYKKSLDELTKMRNNLMNGAGNNATFKNIDDTINNLKTNLTTLQNQFSSNLGIDKMITKAQNSLSKLQLNSSQLNPEVLSRLQQQFNSFNTNTAKSEIQNFIDTTSQLQKTDNNIVKVQKTINRLKNLLDGLKGKYGNLVGNSDSINQLTTFENKIKELESLLTRLKSGNFVNSNSINSTINSANSSFKELTNSVKTSSSAFKLAQQDSISLGQAVQNTLGKFGIYTSLAIACRKVFQEIKEGIQYVKYLDESFTDMSMTISNLTQNQFNEMGKQLDEMAKKMGVTIEAVHDIGRIYSNEQTSTDEILAKTKPTAELSNIAGMDALTASKNMQDIANQFALLEKEGAKASDVFTHIGDTMTAVSRNMTYDFATGIKELSSAISTAGSVAEMSGVSMEKFTSEVGALIEQTGMSGQEVATG